MLSLKSFASIVVLVTYAATATPGCKQGVPLPPVPRSDAPGPKRPGPKADDGAQEPFFPMKQDGKYGYMKQTGEVVIQPAFDSAFPFQEGMAKVRVGELWGFIDSQGQLLVKPKYLRVADFSDGLAAVVMLDDYLGPGSGPGVGLRGAIRVGFIGKTGKYVIEPKYLGDVYSNSFADGRASVRVRSTNRYGYLDEHGEFAIEPVFSRADKFSDGLALVWRDGKPAYIDASGKVVIEVDRFIAFRPFSEGLAGVLAEVMKDGKTVRRWGYINRKGELVVSPRYKSVGKFSEGLAVVKTGFNDPRYVPEGEEYEPAKWGYIDKHGKVVIELQYSKALAFSEGLALVRKDGLYGYINLEGKMVIQPQFEHASGFQGGLARIRSDPGWQRNTAPLTAGRRRVWGKIGYINKSGEYVREPTK